VDFKIIKERKRVNNSRILDLSTINHRGGSDSSCRTQNTISRYTQQCSRQHNRYNRQRLLKDDSGFVVIEFLLVSLILIFLTYSVIEYWLVMTQHQQASHLVNKYLERMSLEGRLSLTDEASLIMDPLCSPVNAIKGISYSYRGITTHRYNWSIIKDFSVCPRIRHQFFPQVLRI
jgi:hypothetical protein